MQYATDRQAAVQQQRGLSSLSCTFVHGSCFDPTVMAALGRFDRIHVGGSCPKPRLRDLLKLLKPGEEPGLPLLSSSAICCAHGMWQVVAPKWCRRAAVSSCVSLLLREELSQAVKPGEVAPFYLCSSVSSIMTK